MQKYLDDRQDITQSQVQVIVQRALSLSRQINATIDDVGQQNIEKQTVMLIREFKAGKFIFNFLDFILTLNFILV